MIFQGFRRFLEVIKALTSSLEDLVRVQRQHAPAIDRLEILERSRHQFEAQCEGLLLKAEGKLKAAASAEQRERQLKKANERLADPFGEAGSDPELAGGDAVQPNHVARVEAEGLPPVRLALARNDKTAAVRAKFGLA